ncbi:MAG: hypothetical protein ACRENE_26735 [Polyangiaceae bacterium]
MHLSPYVRVDDSGGWEPVRDSWVHEPHDTLPPRSEPPPLPASVRAPASERSPADAELATRMIERLAAGDYEASRMAAEALLARLPCDPDALDCAEMSRTALRDLYTGRLGGSLDRAPGAVDRQALARQISLDAITAFVVSSIDGRATLGEIAFSGGAAPEDALRALSELYVRGVIALSE